MTAPAFHPDFAKLVAGATAAALEDALATHRRVRATLHTPAAIARIDRRIEVLELELALRLDLA